MKLVITEKRPVAKEIASLLGIAHQHEYCFVTKSGYFEEPCVITWARGHLLAYDSYSMGNSRWDYKVLPNIITIDKVIEIPCDNFCSDHLSNIIKIITGEAKLAGVYEPITELINAGDCGREGEVIIREIYRYMEKHIDHFNNIKKYRIWSSEAITRDLIVNQLKGDMLPAEHFDELAVEGELRKFSDWLVGCNLTEFYTSLKRERQGSADVASVGRIQTPLVFSIAKRQEEIDSFVPTTTYIPSIKIKTRLNEEYFIDLDNITFNTKDEGHTWIKNHEDISFDLSTSDIYYTKNYSEPLFNNTALGVHMARKYNWSMEKTAEIANRLYQSPLRIMSYPRTGSRYLSESSDVKAKFTSVMKDIMKFFYNEEKDSSYSKTIFALGKRVFNQKEVESTKDSHDAYIVSNSKNLIEKFDKLTEEEKLLVQEVVHRMIQVVESPVQIENKTIYIKFILDSEEVTKRLTGSKPVDDTGWLKYYTEDSYGFNNKEELLKYDLADLKYINISLTIREVVTRCPSHFNSISLLKLLEDNNVGTPATKLYYESLLLDRGYITKQRNQILLSEKGAELVRDLGKNSPFSSMNLTKMLEEEISKGSSSNILPILTKIIEEACSSLINSVELASNDLRCPFCLSTIQYDKYSGTKCTCGFFIPSVYKKRRLTLLDVSKLLNGEKIKSNRFVSVNNKHFTALLYLDMEDGVLKFEF